MARATTTSHSTSSPSARSELALSLSKGQAGQAAEPFPKTLDRVVRGRERVIVRRRGKNVAALVPIEDLAALEELDDRQDAGDFRAAKRQWERGGRKTVPWDKLKSELGL